MHTVWGVDKALLLRRKEAMEQGALCPNFNNSALQQFPRGFSAQNFYSGAKVSVGINVLGDMLDTLFLCHLSLVLCPLYVPEFFSDVRPTLQGWGRGWIGFSEILGGWASTSPPPRCGRIFWGGRVGAEGAGRKNCLFLLLGWWVGGWVRSNSPPPPLSGGGTFLGPCVFQKSGWAGLSNPPPPWLRKTLVHSCGDRM